MTEAPFNGGNRQHIEEAPREAGFWNPLIEEELGSINRGIDRVTRRERLGHELREQLEGISGMRDRYPTIHRVLTSVADDFLYLDGVPLGIAQEFASNLITYVKTGEIRQAGS